MTSPSKDSPVRSLSQVAPVPTDPLRAMLTSLIHETIEREFTQFVGAQRFERTPDRREVRNGFRRRQFSTRVGQLELKIPRDRAGRFQPSLFEEQKRPAENLRADGPLVGRTPSECWRELRAM